MSNATVHIALMQNVLMCPIGLCEANAQLLNERKEFSYSRMVGCAVFS